MTNNVLAQQVGAHTLQAISAGMTVTSIAGAWGYLTGALSLLPIVIAGTAGVSAIVAYTFTTLDSPSFQRKVANWTMRRKVRKLTKLRKQQVMLTAKLQALDTIEYAHEVAGRIVEDARQGVISPPMSRLPGKSVAPAPSVDEPKDTH